MYSIGCSIFNKKIRRKSIYLYACFQITYHMIYRESELIMPVETLMFALLFIPLLTGLFLFCSLQFTSFQDAQTFNCLVTGEFQVFLRRCWHIALLGLGACSWEHLFPGTWGLCMWISLCRMWLHSCKINETGKGWKNRELPLSQSSVWMETFFCSTAWICTVWIVMAIMHGSERQIFRPQYN